jgi:hypothetical protein
LQTRFDPIEFGHLEKFSLLEGTEKLAFAHGFGRAVVQLVQHPHLEQLLVTHTHLGRQTGWAMLLSSSIKDDKQTREHAYAQQGTHMPEEEEGRRRRDEPGTNI